MGSRVSVVGVCRRAIGGVLLKEELELVVQLGMAGVQLTRLLEEALGHDREELGGIRSAVLVEERLAVVLDVVEEGLVLVAEGIARTWCRLCMVEPERLEEYLR